MKLNLATVVKRNPRVITKKLGGKVVLLDPVIGEVHTLNETASFIWLHLSRKNTLTALVKSLVEAYAVPPKTAQTDVFDFVQKYMRDGLIIGAGK